MKWEIYFEIILSQEFLIFAKPRPFSFDFIFLPSKDHFDRKHFCANVETQYKYEKYNWRSLQRQHFYFLEISSDFCINCLNMSKSRIFLSNEVGINMCYQRVRSNNTVTNSQKVKIDFSMNNTTWNLTYLPGTTLPGIQPQTYEEIFLSERK